MTEKKAVSTEMLLKRLAERLTEEENAKNGVLRQGTQIIIPERMTFEDAAKVLIEAKQNAEKEEQYLIRVECHPHDGLISFNNAITRTFGKLNAEWNPGFFGPTPPKMLTINVNHKETVQVPIGEMSIPGLQAKLNVQTFNDGEGTMGIQVSCFTKRKFLAVFREIERVVKEELGRNSIYRGKAIDSEFKFLDLEQFNPNLVVYPKGVQETLEANVWTPIRQTQACKANGMSLKRGVLLYGQYGTGKTLTALETAVIAVENGWTFVNVKPGQDFTDALRTARRYEPSVVFVEDIDSQVSGERTSQLNEILETFDGLVSKDANLMVILTTNHIERINRAMLRPGRLDALIEFGAYDAEAVERFVRIHARDSTGASLLEGSLDRDALYEAAEGYVPAFLAEGVRRAKLHALNRMGVDAAVKPVRLTSDDIIHALESMRAQHGILAEEAVLKQPPIDEHLRNMVKSAAEEALVDNLSQQSIHAQTFNKKGQEKAKQLEKAGTLAPAR